LHTYIYLELNIYFCLEEGGLATFPEIESTPEGVEPLIGVVFNQQKLYISNLHLYSIAPAQGNLQ